jgi:hypothetical protein
VSLQQLKNHWAGLMLHAFLSVHDQHTLQRGVYEQMQQMQQLCSKRRKRKQEMKQPDVCITYSTASSAADERAMLAAALVAAQQKQASAEHYQRIVRGCATLADAAAAVQEALGAAGTKARLRQLLPDDGALLSLGRSFPGWETQPQQRVAITAAAIWLAEAAAAEMRSSDAEGCLMWPEEHLERLAQKGLRYVKAALQKEESAMQAAQQKQQQQQLQDGEENATATADVLAVRQLELDHHQQQQPASAAESVQQEQISQDQQQQQQTAGVPHVESDDVLVQSLAKALRQTIQWQFRPSSSMPQLGIQQQQQQLAPAGAMPDTGAPDAAAAAAAGCSAAAYQGPAELQGWQMQPRALASSAHLQQQLQQTGLGSKAHALADTGSMQACPAAAAVAVDEPAAAEALVSLGNASEAAAAEGSGLRRNARKRGRLQVSRGDSSAEEQVKDGEGADSSMMQVH